MVEFMVRFWELCDIAFMDMPELLFDVLFLGANLDSLGNILLRPLPVLRLVGLFLGSSMTVMSALFCAM